MANSKELDAEELISHTFHEIAQPLTSLRACLDLALRKPMDGNGYRQALRDAVEQHERLVDSLQSARHLAEAFTPGVPQPCDVSEVLSELRDMFLPVANEKNIELQSDLNEAQIIRTDRERVRQLLFLVMDDVLHHCNENCVKIASTLNGDQVLITMKCNRKVTDGNASITHKGMMRQALANSIEAQVREYSEGDLNFAAISIPDILG